jgi:DNA repair exonuclease SbcCD nuclease subunit
MGNMDVALRFLEKLGALVSERQPDAVLFLGDLMHNHAIIRSEIMNLWIEYFEKVQIPHIALVGNHDKVSSASSVHALAAFKAFVRVIDAPTIFRGMLFIPYIHTSVEFRVALEQKGAAKILFCHQSFDGAQFENGMYDPCGFPVELVAGSQKVISGHIHKQQSFANIWYPGSPFAQNFNDVGENKAVWLLDTDTLEAQPINLGLPEYFTQEGMSPQDVIDQLQKIAGDAALCENHYKFILQGTKVEITALQDSAEFKKLRSMVKLTLCPHYTDTIQRDEKITDTLTPEQMLSTYIDGVMKTDLDREQLKNLALEVLKNALTV